MVNSRAKGARFERGLCVALKEVFGWTARRSQQFCGNAGDADLIVQEMPLLFVESKAVEKLNVVVALEKAAEQSQGKLPVLFHKKNRTGWMVTLKMTDVPEFLKMVQAASGCTKPEQPEPMCGSGTT
jgi:Holliday junction resolvase